MYDTYYKLSVDPFRLSPDHRFCLRHRSFAKARAYLHYALSLGEGFVMITGAPGSGKTTLFDEVLSEPELSRFTVARLNMTQLGAEDLLQMVAYSFKQNIEGHNKAYLLHHLEIFLQQQHRMMRRAILIIDEAQDLSAAALEEVRLLTNLELNERPLLQVFLVGQDQLHETIGMPSMVQLQQRLVAHTRIESMTAEETTAYILHRLRVADWSGDPQIGADALQEIFAFSHGVPRRVNQLCSRLLLYGMLEEKHLLNSSDVWHVINELHDEWLLPSEDETLFSSRPEIADTRATQTVFDSPAHQPELKVIHARADIPHEAYALHRSSLGNGALVPDRFAHRFEIAGNLALSPELQQPLPKLRVPPIAVTHLGGTVHDIYPDARSRNAELPRADAAPAQQDNHNASAKSDAQRDARSRGVEFQRHEKRQLELAVVIIGTLLVGSIYAVYTDRSVTLPLAEQTASNAPLVLPAVAEAPIELVTPPAAIATNATVLSEPGEIAPGDGLALAATTRNEYVIHPGDDSAFAFGSAKINDALRATLDAVADRLRRETSARIRVAGHSDNIGSTKVNLDLSLDRAKAAVDYLAHQGIGSHRLHAEARGSMELKSVDDPSQNRRVEIYIESDSPTAN
jgi:type II secretory pathway predicted ATPase ExeA/outer membrane protein OmpA-like peptidoglycan-associated protein